MTLDDWQSIETAPIDGTRFLAWEVTGPFDEEDEETGIIKHDQYESCCVVAYFCFGSIVTYPWNGSNVSNRRFTHWCQLPDGPANVGPRLEAVGS